ncbi:MAG: ATP-binding protein, partial [Anaerolineales bacterium]|nr:ATP-binding protein [Anaerolineales bacterium]
PLLSDENLSAAKRLPKVKDDAEGGAGKISAEDIPRRHILVVEDEISQSSAVCGWLRELGQSVEVAHNAEDALAFLAKITPDIAIVDVGLPNMSGTDLAKIILQKYPQIQVVNATDWARANETQDALDELQTLGGKLLYKPILSEDLAAYLLYEQDQRTAPPQAEEKPSLSIPNLNAKKTIHALLAMYKKHLGAEQVFLFSLDTAHRRVNIAERVGDGIVNKNAVAQLIYSPVRDAAEDGEIVVSNEIGERERKRFQYLLEFSPLMISCLGVPVPAQTTLKYALFALDKRSKQLGGEYQIYAQGVALAIGAALDQNELRERSALIQRSALIGNLASGMIHEMNNLAGPLLFEADTVKKNLARLSEESGKNDYTDVNNELLNIEQDIRQIVGITKAFGKIVRKAATETIRVDEMIDNTLLLLREISRRARVRLQFNAPDHLVVVRNQPVVLEQIFLNVVLNAVQQVSEWRKNGEGYIQIDLDMGLIDGDKDAVICRILVSDNGPGVHASLWERIFEMGFSTRKDGSGIGLHVSRNLIENMNGRIYVADSHVLSGSVFALEFPIYA